GPRRGDPRPRAQERHLPRQRPDARARAPDRDHATGRPRADARRRRREPARSGAAETYRCRLSRREGLMLGEIRGEVRLKEPLSFHPPLRIGGLGGIECLVGIPATVGGALAMNAGTPDGWIGDFVSAVYFLHPDGSLGEFKPATGTFTFSTFHPPAGSVLIGCRLRLTRRPLGEI